MKMRLIY